MALARLEHDGLFERERHRGARVRRVSGTEAVEILEARAALEGLAARHAAENADDVAVGRLHGIVADMHELRVRGDLLGVSNANAQLHGLILEISGHQTARRLSQTLSSQLVRFQYRTVLLPEDPSARTPSTRRLSRRSPLMIRTLLSGPCAATSRTSPKRCGAPPPQPAP